jgi:hypothetical protein
LARDGAAAHRLARRANALVLPPLASCWWTGVAYRPVAGIPPMAKMALVHRRGTPLSSSATSSRERSTRREGMGGSRLRKQPKS